MAERLERPGLEEIFLDTVGSNPGLCKEVELLSKNYCERTMALSLSKVSTPLPCAPLWVSPKIVDCDYSATKMQRTKRELRTNVGTRNYVQTLRTATSSRGQKDANQPANQKLTYFVSFKTILLVELNHKCFEFMVGQMKGDIFWRRDATNSPQSLKTKTFGKVYLRFTLFLRFLVY